MNRAKLMVELARKLDNLVVPVQLTHNGKETDGTQFRLATESSLNQEKSGIAKPDIFESAASTSYTTDRDNKGRSLKSVTEIQEDESHSEDVSSGSEYEPEEHLSTESSNTTDNEFRSDDQTEQLELTQRINNRKRGTGAVENWKRIKNKQFRMEGKEYMGLKKNEGGKYQLSIKKSARKMGPTCNSAKCKKSSNRDCSKLSDSNRKHIFSDFWEKLSWEQRKIYVASLVNVCDTKRSKGHELSRRHATLEYHLKFENTTYRVCKFMFLSTLSLGEWCVKDWAQNSSRGSGMHEKFGKYPSRKREVPEMIEAKQSMEEFFKCLPVLPSHYCRAKSSKLYIQPDISSKLQLFRLYAEYCESHQVRKVGRKLFEKQFSLGNFALYTPKKDQCDTCVSHSVGNIEDSVYAAHTKEKDIARAEKEADKSFSQSNTENIVLTMDLQAVKLSPVLNASGLYFKTKLCVHNFTTYNLADGEVHCYVWHEAEGGLTASVFATCIVDVILKTIDETTKQVILWSDGCTYQNKNVSVSNALLGCAIDKNITIIQKYLVKGHTQMEADSVHATIEKRLKNKVINVPADYIPIIKNCRVVNTKNKEKNAYNVHYLGHEFFKNYEKFKIYSSIRPGFKVGDPTVTEIRALKYLPKGEILYKLKFTDDWETLPRRPLLPPNYSVITNLYSNPLPITTAKFNHLQELKTVLTSDFHSFYDNLPYV